MADAESELADSDDVPTITDSDVYYLASLYGIKSYMISFIKPLPSYDDRVFHIGIYKKFQNKEKSIIPLVMKCSIINSFNRMDMQIQFMKLLYYNNVPSPKPILLLPQNIQKRTNYHKYIYKTTNNPLQNENSLLAKYKVNVHCMSYISNGILANKIDQTNMSFLSNLGESCGKLSHSVRTFKHKASQFEFIWDIQFAQRAFPKFKYVKNEGKRKLLQGYIDSYNNILLPAIKGNKLRKSIIHGDLNDMNMMCNADGVDKRIIAFFDFGDVKNSCTIFDIAICCAYFMLNKDKEMALKVFYQILKSYHKVYPLTGDEINVFWVAVMSRILTSVLIASEKIGLHPENS